MRRAAILLASLAAPLMALAAQPDGDVGARIAGSAIAAQSLQGPLDGTWALTDSKRHTLFVFQLVDPASGDGELQAAWREPSAHGTVGSVARVSRSGERLSLAFAVQGQLAQASLRRGAGGVWRGQLHRGRGTIAVSLRRPS